MTNGLRRLTFGSIFSDETGGEETHFDEDRRTEDDGEEPEKGDDQLTFLARQFRLERMHEGDVTIDGHGSQRVNRTNDKDRLGEGGKFTHEQAEGPIGKKKIGDEDDWNAEDADENVGQSEISDE